jgi:uncharacterized protein YbjT (DUF2867 family)
MYDAFEDIDTVIFIPSIIHPSIKRIPEVENLISAAKQSGVSHIIYIGSALIRFSTSGILLIDGCMILGIKITVSISSNAVTILFTNQAIEHGIDRFYIGVRNLDKVPEQWRNHVTVRQLNYFDEKSMVTAFEDV